MFCHGDSMIHPGWDSAANLTSAHDDSFAFKETILGNRVSGNSQAVVELNLLHGKGYPAMCSSK